MRWVRVGRRRPIQVSGVRRVDVAEPAANLLVQSRARAEARSAPRTSPICTGSSERCAIPGLRRRVDDDRGPGPRTCSALRARRPRGPRRRKVSSLLMLQPPAMLAN